MKAFKNDCENTNVENLDSNAICGRKVVHVLPLFKKGVSISIFYLLHSLRQQRFLSKNLFFTCDLLLATNFSTKKTFRRKWKNLIIHEAKKPEAKKEIIEK
jgi:hypothetical protein